MEGGNRYLLPILMVSGATLGIIIGAVFADHWTAEHFKPFRGFFKLLADILLNLLKALVVPLIVCSVIHAMAGIGDIRRAGRLFFMTVSYFVITMMMAVTLGMVLVNTIKPGVGASTELRSEDAKARAAKAEQVKRTPAEAMYDVVRSMFPSNLVKVAAESDVLGLILFSIVFGAILTTMGERGLQLGHLFGTLNDALMTFVQLVIWFAPVGIMGLVADRIGSLGGFGAIKGELVRLGWYALTVVLGLLVHGLIVLPAILYFISKRNPLRYAINQLEALICAFSTASSAATLPLTIKCLEKNNKISPRTVGFVVPLGATVNMNGTALYEAVAAIFIAQAYGINLSMPDQFLILVTATLAAIGAAAIPEAGLVTMVVVLVAVDLPLDGIGLILAIDWILDRCRTTVNVWDDCVASAVVEHWTEKMQQPAPVIGVPPPPPAPEVAPVLKTEPSGQ
jgi:Na+/H+-dicarboxylate symporter